MLLPDDATRKVRTLLVADIVNVRNLVQMLEFVQEFTDLRACRQRIRL
jgi:hypothetical protein